MFNQLVRNPGKVHACLEELEDGRLVAKRPIKAYIPMRFAERNLASVGVETYICLFALVTEDGHFCTSLVNAMHRIEPAATNKVVIKDTDYYEFVFPAGCTVFRMLYLYKNKTLVYRIYDELIAKGRVPEYFTYSDLGHIFDTAGLHAGTNVGSDTEKTELLVSMIGRNPDNRMEYYRRIAGDTSGPAVKPVAWVPLKSVTYSATNTLNKLAGSYMHDGIVSALVSPSERTERLESLLKR